MEPEHIAPATSLRLTPDEKKRVSILLVGPNLEFLHRRLGRMGYARVTPTAFHQSGVKKIEDRTFTHVLFSAGRNDLDPSLFLKLATQSHPSAIYIAVGGKPAPQSVIQMLRAGAHGFLCVPATDELIDAIIGQATKGERLPVESTSPELWGEHLLRVAFQHLDAFAEALKTAILLKRAPSTCQALFDRFRVMTAVAQSFCQDGHSGYFQRLEEMADELSLPRMTRIKKVRLHLAKLRAERDEKGGS